MNRCKKECTEMIPEHSSNRLGFLGGPAWHYPEEEIEFSSQDESDGQLESILDDDDNESCSDDSMDNFRIAMIEKYIEMHDIQVNDQNLFDILIRNGDNILPQHSPCYTLDENCRTKCGSKLADDDEDDDNIYSTLVNPESSSNHGSPKMFEPSRNNKRNTLSSRSHRPKREVNTQSINIGVTSNDERQLHLLQEASLCIPFEYTTKLATYYIRRPYGVTTVPEIFQVLCPHVTDEMYSKRSRASSSETIQVAIVNSADNSFMLLHESAGFRYKKTDPNDFDHNKWIDVPDVGVMDVPLGFVSNESFSERNSIIEYSLDEIVKEAMLVREQYCSTVRSAAMEIERQQMLAKTKTQSPPSLAKSIVSTPHTISNYYYDGSSNNAKVVEADQDEQIKGRKLDFFQCISPTLLTKGSNETIITQPPQRSAHNQRKRKSGQNGFYRLCQRVIIVIGFYCCAIFLVANLSVANHHRPSTVVVELLPESYKTIFANNLVPNIFIKKFEQQQHYRNHTHSDNQLTKNAVVEEQESLPQLQTSGIVESSTTNDLFDTNRSAYIETLENERNSFKQELEITQGLLREHGEQNDVLFQKYSSERIKTQELETDRNNAMTLVKKLRRDTVALAADLELEQEQRHKLEVLIRELEIQVLSLKKEISQMNHETASSASEIRSDVTNLQGFIPEFENRALGEELNEEYQIQKQQQLNEKDNLRGGNAKECLDTTVKGHENRSLPEEENHDEGKGELIAADGLVLKSSMYGLQSMENVILMSARANKGPVIPKIFRYMKKHFSEEVNGTEKKLGKLRLLGKRVHALAAKKWTKRMFQK